MIRPSFALEALLFQRLDSDLALSSDPKSWAFWKCASRTCKFLSFSIARRIFYVGHDIWLWCCTHGRVCSFGVISASSFMPLSDAIAYVDEFGQSGAKYVCCCFVFKNIPFDTCLFRPLMQMNPINLVMVDNSINLHIHEERKPMFIASCGGESLLFLKSPWIDFEQNYLVMSENHKLKIIDARFHSVVWLHAISNPQLYIMTFAFDSFNRVFVLVLYDNESQR